VRILHDGDSIYCVKCGRGELITKSWIRNTFPSLPVPAVNSHDLSVLVCAKCSVRGFSDKPVVAHSPLFKQVSVKPAPTYSPPVKQVSDPPASDDGPFPGRFPRGPFSKSPPVPYVDILKPRRWRSCERCGGDGAMGECPACGGNGVEAQSG
jgi:hypothetical protein